MLLLYFISIKCSMERPGGAGELCSFDSSGFLPPPKTLASIKIKLPVGVNTCVNVSAWCSVKD